MICEIKCIFIVSFMLERKGKWFKRELREVELLLRTIWNSLTWPSFDPSLSDGTVAPVARSERLFKFYSKSEFCRLLSGLSTSSLYYCSAGQRWANHRKLLTPAFHFKVLENFVDVFNRNGKILVEKLSSHVNGPEFDVTPYMTLCALDNMSGECRASSLCRRSLKCFTSWINSECQKT